MPINDPVPYAEGYGDLLDKLIASLEQSEKEKFKDANIHLPNKQAKIIEVHKYEKDIQLPSLQSGYDAGGIHRQADKIGERSKGWLNKLEI